MGRGKLKLELIANEKARRTTFQKRKRGILKKAYEFSVLCGVDVCLFVSAGDPGSEVETWPPERDAVLNVVRRYRAAAARKPPRICGVPDVLADRKRKINGEISRCRRRTGAARFPDATELLASFSPEELARVAERLAGKIAEVEAAIGERKAEMECSRVKSEEENKRVSAPDEILYNGATGSECTDTSVSWNPVYLDPTAPGVHNTSLMYGATGSECTGTSALWNPVYPDPTAPGVHKTNLMYGATGSECTGTSALWNLVYPDPTAPGVHKTSLMYGATGSECTGTSALWNPVYPDPMAPGVHKTSLMYGATGSECTGTSALWNPVYPVPTAPGVHKTSLMYGATGSECTGTAALWNPVYPVPTAWGIHEMSATYGATRRECTETSALWNLVYPDPMAPGVHEMSMTHGVSSSYTTSLTYPISPYTASSFQHPLGPISQVIRTACEGNSELCSVVNGFMHRRMG